MNKASDSEINKYEKEINKYSNYFFLLKFAIRQQGMELNTNE
jgi:hypothetical protein